MNIKHISLKAGFLQTIDRYNGTIVDRASAGIQYFLDGSSKQLLKYHYDSFDRAISSADKTYTFIYKALGTKGLLLKNGELMREINRSYYCSDNYEYPAVFVTVADVTYLIHCPRSYDSLDFENVETGELVTDISARKRSGVFHSRLEVSPNGTTLICRSWVWHPLDCLEIFDIEACLNDPTLLDVYTFRSLDEAEICTASFVDNDNILVGSSYEVIDDERDNTGQLSIAILDIKTGKTSTPVKVNTEFGNLFAIDENFAWDMYKYPKIIDIRTGEVVAKAEHVDSGEQNSAIIGHDTPQIIFDRETKMIAIAGSEQIDVLMIE